MIRSAIDFRDCTLPHCRSVYLNKPIGMQDAHVLRGAKGDKVARRSATKTPRYCFTGIQ